MDPSCNRTRAHLLLTTYYCIPLYALPITEETAVSYTHLSARFPHNRRCPVSRSESPPESALLPDFPDPGVLPMHSVLLPDVFSVLPVSCPAASGSHQRPHPPLPQPTPDTDAPHPLRASAPRSLHETAAQYNPQPRSPSVLRLSLIHICLPSVGAYGII